MSEVVHARVDKELLAKVDKMIERSVFPNRSGAIREATRQMVSKVFSQSTNDRLLAVAESASAMIAEIIQSGISRIVLYGSVARREAGDDSDIDLLVLVSQGTDPGEALTQIIGVTAPIEAATETVITPLVMKKSEYERVLSDGFSFARSVAKDGVTLYGEDG